MNFAHTESYKVRNHEIEGDQTMTVPALLLIMQDASMINAEQLKVSKWDMAERNVSWVLLRKELNIYNLPHRGDIVDVLTYPAGFDRVFAYRDFKMFGQRENGKDSGKLLAEASSTWTLMNMSTRKMERIPQSFYQFKPKNSYKCLDKPLNKIADLTQVDLSSNYRIARYDLDWNGHVNNVVLTKLILQTMPQLWLDTPQIEKYTIHIKSECFLGDILEINFQEVSKTETRHQIKGGDGRIVATAISVWK